MKLEDLLSNRKERLNFGLKPSFEKMTVAGLRDRILRFVPDIDPVQLDTISAELMDAWKGFEANYQGRVRGRYRDETQKLEQEFDKFLEEWLIQRGILPLQDWRRKDWWLQGDIMDTPNWKKSFEERTKVMGKDAVRKGIDWALGVAYDTIYDSVFGSEYEGVSRTLGPEIVNTEEYATIKEDWLYECFGDDYNEHIRSAIEQAGLDYLAKNPNATAAEVWAAMDLAAVNVAAQRIPDYVRRIGEILDK